MPNDLFQNLETTVNQTYTKAGLIGEATWAKLVRAINESIQLLGLKYTKPGQSLVNLSSQIILSNSLELLPMALKCIPPKRFFDHNEMVADVESTIHSLPPPEKQAAHHFSMNKNERVQMQNTLTQKMFKDH